MANVVLRIATLNCRGLNRQLKRRAIFKSMSTYDIICLQETYITENKTAEWEREWGGEFLYSAHTNKTAGQIILINTNFKYDNLKSFFSYGPRIIGVELEIDKKQYTMVNCYGPANRQERPSFLDSLNSVISKLYQNNLILCGDFNMVQNNSLGIIEGYPHGQKETEAFVNIIKVWDLQDTWRKVNGDNTDFTWSKKNPFIARRLDYIFCDSI